MSAAQQQAGILMKHMTGGLTDVEKGLRREAVHLWCSTMKSQQRQQQSEKTTLMMAVLNLLPLPEAALLFAAADDCPH